MLEKNNDNVKEQDDEDSPAGKTQNRRDAMNRVRYQLDAQSASSWTGVQSLEMVSFLAGKNRKIKTVNAIPEAVFVCLGWKAPHV